jgi:hypothetical protein
MFKISLLWLLIAALPIQGMAAFVKASCGPAHPEWLLTAIMSEAHHHDGELARHHHEGNAVADNHQIGAPPTAAAALPDADYTHQSSFCSACAECGFGDAAPPPTAPWNPALVRSETAVLPPSIQFTGYIPAGLERPPRHPSA